MVRQLLKTNSVDSDSKDVDNQTMLLFTAGEGEMVVKQLLERNSVDPDLEDNDNLTPLSSTTEEGPKTKRQVLQNPSTQTRRIEMIGCRCRWRQRSTGGEQLLKSYML
jgi:ankyrin repeat protein